MRAVDSVPEADIWHKIRVIVREGDWPIFARRQVAIQTDKRSVAMSPPFARSSRSRGTVNVTSSVLIWPFCTAAWSCALAA